MKRHIIPIIFAISFIFCVPNAFSQVLVSDNPAAVADPSAMLDIQSTSKGFLFPRMTQAQRNAISSPPKSMIVYQTDMGPGLYYNVGTAGLPNWQKLTDATTPSGYWTLTGSDIYYDAGNVGVGTDLPSSTLHVVGNARITSGLRLDAGSSAGYVLTSDAIGNTSWTDPLGITTANDNDWWFSGSDLYSAASGNVGIGTAAPSYKLHVVGSARITGALRFDAGATAGYVLTTDVSGNASWQAPAGGDSDWTISGSNQYSAVTGNVGIGLTGPTSKLHVVGSGRITGPLRLDFGATDGYVLTSDAGGNASWVDVNGLVSNDDDWSINGNDIYNANSGNVGIGTTTPGANLEVNGSGWFNDSLYITGRPGQLRLDAEPGYGGAIHYEYNDQTKFSWYYRLAGGSFSTDYLMLKSFQSVHGTVPNPNGPELIGYNPNGRIFQNYQGSSAAFMQFSDAAFPMMYIEIGDASANANGIQTRIQNASSNVGSLCMGGWNYGHGSAVYGQNVLADNYGYLGTENHGAYGENDPTGNRGALGTPTTGAYGVHDASGNQGNLGLTNFGAQGSHGTSTYWAALGTSTAGVYARMTPDGSSQSLAVGDFAVKGVGVEIATGNSGANYALGNQLGGVLGYNSEGTSYSAGVAGYTESDPDNRASGVFGGFLNAVQWGALGYKNSSGTRYGGYFTNTTTGTGKAISGPSSSIGIGVYGDLFGAHVDGQVYGLYATGNDYGIYADGDVYRTGADIHLQTDNQGQNNVMYTLVTPEMTIQTYGIGQLQGGKSNIDFDDAFANVVSDTEPIIVTITPIGESQGVYLKNVDGKGFSVVENNKGKSNVQFSWIAIGKRSGYENKSLPADVIASDYNNKIQTGLHNDSDISTDGQGLYYEDGKLNVGKPLQSRSGDNSTLINDVKLERGSLGDKDKTVNPTQDKSASDIPNK